MEEFQQKRLIVGFSIEQLVEIMLEGDCDFSQRQLSEENFPLYRKTAAQQIQLLDLLQVVQSFWDYLQVERWTLCVW